MEKSVSPPSKKDSEYKDNEGSGDSNEWSDISSSSDEGGNEGKLEKSNKKVYILLHPCFCVLRHSTHYDLRRPKLT